MKFLKTLRKRGLALFLVLTMCMSLLPTQAMAAEGDRRNPDGPKDLNPNPGEVQADKYYTKNDNGTYTLHLKVKGGEGTATTSKSNADVVLVIDNSGSMTDPTANVCNTPQHQFLDRGNAFLWVKKYECPNCGYRYYKGLLWDERPDRCPQRETRMTAAKKVGMIFAEDLFASDNGNQVAVVGFASDVVVRQGLSDADNARNVITAINNMSANGGTNYTKALQQAQQYLNGRRDKSRPAYVVFISDGAPGEYGDAQDKPAYNGAKEIEALKKDGVTIYTIGIELDREASSYLQSMASEVKSEHYRNVQGADYAAQLEEIMKQWAAQINTVPAGRGASMTDVISDQFEIAKDANGHYLVSSNLTVDEDGKTVHWNIGEINTNGDEATIVIKAKDGTVGDNLPTNERVELVYTDGNGVEQTIPTDQIGDPKVDIPPSKPNDKDLEEIIPGPKDETPESPAIAGKVQVVCDNEYANHQPQTFGWTPGKANAAGVVSDVTKVGGEYQVTVTLRASDYTGRYASTATHTQVTGDGKNQDVTLTLKWNSETKKWTRADVPGSEFDAIFHVNCDHKGYTVSYNGNGNTSGTAPEDNTRYAENASAIIQGQGDLEKTGYTFAGWNTAADGSGEDVAITSGDDNKYTMTSNLTLYAQWNPSENTAYKVKHYVEALKQDGTETGSIQKADGKYYTLKEEEPKRGTTGEQTEAEAKSYEGFTAPETVAQQTIAANGSTVVEILYTRNSYTLSFEVTGDHFTNDPYDSIQNVKYGTPLPVSGTPTAQNHGDAYRWNGWYYKDSEGNALTTMPAAELTATGYYEPLTATYEVWARVPNLANVDAEFQIKTGSGQIGTQTNEAAELMDGFDVKVEQTTILADGTAKVWMIYTRNNYTITYEVIDSGDFNGVKGSEQVPYHGRPSSVPTNMEQEGYIWSGWTNLPSSMPAEDVTVTGYYTPATDTAYTVKHMLQNVDDDEYVLALDGEEHLAGTTGEKTVAEAKEFTGFEAQEFEQETIAPNGSTEVTIYYDRKIVTITYLIQGLGGDYAGMNFGESNPYRQDSVRYGTALVLQAGPGEIPGYTWEGWSGAVSGSEVTADLTITGTYEANADTTYTVYHWQEELDGGFAAEPYRTEQKQGVTDAQTDAKALEITGFTAQPIVQATIKGDGNTVVNVYYSRNAYTVTYEITGSFFTNPNFAKFENVKYGAAVPQPAEDSTTQPGYTFSGWGEIPDSVTKDLHFTGSYTGNEGIKYTVEHYLENLTENQYAAPETETKVGTAGAETAAEARNYPGFTAQSFEQVDIAGDNSTVVKIYYTRNSYTISYNPNGGTAPDNVSYGDEFFRFDSDTAIKAAPVREGYAFLYWTDGTGKQYNPGEEIKMPAGDLALTANWRPTAARVSVTKVLSSVNGNAYVDGSLVNVGDTLVYTITVTNISTMTLTDVAVTDPLTRDTWTVASLAPNASDRHEVTYVVDEDDAGNQITNTAVASSDDTVDVPDTEVIPVNARYTVTYTDGVAGEEIFADQSYTLNAGTETPVFAGGTPVREGYTFNGWSPAVADTVTGDVTYTAQWTANTPTPVPPIVVPPVTIPDGPTPLAPGGDTILDDEVPLAAPGLNSTDHFDYVKGYEDGTVRPEANITRAEVATIFFRLMTQEYRMENWSTENSFSDVTVDTWYNNAISTATKAGILTGYPEGDFRPEKPITRAEFASIAARFASEEVTQRGRFSDIQGHWAEENIERAAAAGWVKGENGKFRPEAYITRAEVITAVNRMLDRVPDADHLLDGMKTFVDNVPGMWYYADVQEATNSHDYERDETGINEVWTELKPDQDWTALEKEWADAAAANVAGVAAGLNGGSESEGETEGESATKTEG